MLPQIFVEAFFWCISMNRMGDVEVWIDIYNEIYEKVRYNFDRFRLFLTDSLCFI